MISHLKSGFRNAIDDVQYLCANEQTTVYGLGLAVAAVALGGPVDFTPLFAGAGVSTVFNRLVCLQSGKTTSEEFAASIDRDFNNLAIKNDFLFLLEAISGVKGAPFTRGELAKLVNEYLDSAVIEVERAGDRDLILKIAGEVAELRVVNNQLLFELSLSEQTEKYGKLVNDLIEYNGLPRRPGSGQVIRNFVQSSNLLENLRSL
ncbi:protein of unknown function [Pseudodesulfovibrio profundus]|uniref:Uncharacterized protein n=1 Tax=Pseudodesulfovibrio profundus TaxID=57320 RepID=A0A2C8F669_9BACT|nr:hypothetical protein [Pseudodesulfovibrio profundus]SOB58055.1 protein of unknown function [Pseudodesulfovibrio profundus]